MQQISDTFLDTYSYVSLKQQYPQVDVFRAGFLVFCRGSIFMVKQRARIEKINDREQVFDAHWGFPKGSSESTDRTALETAARELFEEAGIDIFATNPHILQTAFVILRDREMMIFFIARYDDIPPVEHHATLEIIDGAWFPLNLVPSDTNATTAIAIQMINKYGIAH